MCRVESPSSQTQEDWQKRLSAYSSIVCIAAESGCTHDHLGAILMALWWKAHFFDLKELSRISEHKLMDRQKRYRPSVSSPFLYRFPSFLQGGYALLMCRIFWVSAGQGWVVWIFSVSSAGDQNWMTNYDGSGFGIEDVNNNCDGYSANDSACAACEYLKFIAFILGIIRDHWKVRANACRFPCFCRPPFDLVLVL